FRGEYIATVTVGVSVEISGSGEITYTVEERLCGDLIGSCTYRIRAEEGHRHKVKLSAEV
ncbi:MAG: hypothetical protein IJ080_01265, partial [Oscillospiraceae bacterium]|nr:hypothetical protein [Oscillospiraceae bacterium]